MRKKKKKNFKFLRPYPNLSIPYACTSSQITLHHVYNTLVSTYHTSLACEINRGGEGRGRSAARADNKFPNIIFSFVPVFSPRIIALLTSPSSPFSPHLFLFPYFSFPFFFFFFGQRTRSVTRALAIRKCPLSKCISWDFFTHDFPNRSPASPCCWNRPISFTTPIMQLRAR